MVTVWWTAFGIIHHSFLQQGETMTAVKYCEELQTMYRKLREKQPALVNRKGPILLHDNARPHVARLTLQTLTSMGIEVLSHPPYSPDLAPTDFHFFKHLDAFLKDKQFETQTDAETAFQTFLDSRSDDFYKKGIDDIVPRWHKCIQSYGAYFD